MENWLPFPDTRFAADYAVSSHGRIKRVTAGRNTAPGKVLRPYATRSGRLCIRLRARGGGKFSFQVSRLVALAFIPNPEGKSQVNHCDGNPRNNRSDNLEWCTAAENEAHAVRCGLKARGFRHGNAKLTEEQAVLIQRRYWEWGETQSSLAREHGVSQTTVWHIVHGVGVWTHVTSVIPPSKRRWRRSR